MLYEIITGQQTIERNKTASLLEWVKEYSSESQRFGDPLLLKNCSAARARSLAKLVDLGVKANNNEKSSIEIIVERLMKIVKKMNSRDFLMSKKQEWSRVTCSVEFERRE